MDRKNKLTYSDEEIGEILANPSEDTDPLRNVSAEDRIKYSTEGYFNWLAYETDHSPVSVEPMKRSDKLLFLAFISFWILSALLLIVVAVHFGYVQSGMSSGALP